jgi:peroxiredoxin
MNLPEFTMDPLDPTQARQYLRLDHTKPCSISQIPAKLVLIELFSIYCTVCQRHAPTANKLYSSIQRDSALCEDIKMIGIGTGNNQREVGFYKKTFRVRFPLFTDPNFDIHKKFGKPRTPFTVLATNSGKVLMTHFGTVQDLDAFLGQIRKFHKQSQ